jgi:hypothetical protein
MREPGGEEIALHEFDAGIREALPATGNHLCGTVQGAQAARARSTSLNSETHWEVAPSPRS